jgi:hypothetical protein
MFSKHILLSSILILSIGLVSCFRIGEKPPEHKAPEVGKNTRCFEHMDIFATKYINHKLPTAAVGEFWDCTDRALDLFMTFVKGQNAESYSPNELKRFLENFLIVDKKIPDSLVFQAMKFKQAMMGGGENNLTLEDIKRIQFFIRLMKSHTKRIYPYVGYIFGTRSDKKPLNEVEHREFLMGLELLRSAVKETSLFLMNSKQTYSLEDFSALYDDVCAYMGFKADKKILHGEAIAELAQAVKALMTQTPSEKIEPQDWEPVMTTIAETYTLFMNYKYNLRHQSLYSGSGYDDFVWAVNRMFLLLGRVVNDNNGVIKQSAFTRVFRVLEIENLLPAGVSSQALDTTWSRFLKKVLTNPHNRTLNDENNVGLTRIHLTQAQSEFYLWTKVQDEIIVWSRLHKTEFKTPPPIASEILRITGNPGFDEFQRLLSTVRPLYLPGDNRIFISQNLALGHNFTQLSKLNTARSMMRLLIRGYAKDEARAINLVGITEDEMQEMYLDLRDLGIQMGFMDRRSKGVGIRSSIEANLFTFIGNGDRMTTFEEGSEWLQFALSSVHIADQIYTDLVATCKREDMDRVYNLPLLSASKVSLQFRHDFAKYFGNLPGLAAFVAKMSDEEWDQYFQSLRNLAQVSVEDQDVLDNAQISTIAAVIQYTEAGLTRFDLNHDELLSGEELTSAYHGVYQDLFVRMAKFKSNLNVGLGPLSFGVYEFLIDNGRLPSSFGDYATLPLRFPAFDERRLEENVSIDRLRLMKVFEAVVQSLH